jgi:hypothetical protein
VFKKEHRYTLFTLQWTGISELHFTTGISKGDPLNCSQLLLLPCLGKLCWKLQNKLMAGSMTSPQFTLVMCLFVLHHLQLPHLMGLSEKDHQCWDVQPMFAFWFNFLKENRRSSQASQGRFRFLKIVWSFSEIKPHELLSLSLSLTRYIKSSKICPYKTKRMEPKHNKSNTHTQINQLRKNNKNSEQNAYRLLPSALYTNYY